MKLHLRELPKQIALSYSSQPGIGKTDTINAAAETMKKRVDGFKLIHIDVPSMSPTDIGATMPNRETGLLEFFCNAMLPNFYVDPNWTGIINFGEILNTDPTTLKLMQKYDNGEDINGRLRKPVGAVIIADSNRIIDKSGVVRPHCERGGDRQGSEGRGRAREAGRAVRSTRAVGDARGHQEHEADGHLHRTGAA
jgi:hypothetical protein